MTVRPLAYLLVCALGVGAAGLSACGSGSSKSLIPMTDAGPLQDDFNSAAAAISDHDCPGASAAVRQAQAHVDSLPRATSAALRQRLREGLQTLQTQAAEECLPETTTETTPTETTTDTVPTDTFPTDTLPTDTTTDTLPTDTVPTDTTTVPTPTPDPGGAQDQLGDGQR